MPPKKPAGPKMLRSVPTSVTGARMTVEQEASGLRLLYLDGHEQSEVQVLSNGELSPVQPLELVQVMSLFSLAWLSGGAAAGVEAPSVLLIGIGGGSIVRVLAGTLPPRGSVYSLDLEPEVVQAAIDFFAMPIAEGRSTAEAGDGAAHMRDYRAHRAAGSVPGYDVLLLDAFTSEGLCASTQRQSTLDDAAACLSPGGLLLINLHTGKKNDPDDDDYYVARRVLRALCQRFDAVYSFHCATTQNIIGVCHNGDFLDAGAWESRLDATLARTDVRPCMPAGLQLAPMMERLEFMGGKAEPMADERGVGELKK